MRLAVRVIPTRFSKLLVQIYAFFVLVSREKQFPLFGKIECLLG